MEAKTYKKTASILLILLGMCHQSIHFMFALNKSESPQIMTDMAAYEINIIGHNTLMEFYAGFSLMTGSFIICLGIIAFLLNKRISDRTIDLWILVMILLIVLISIIYFHILAYGVSAIAALLYFLAIIKPTKNSI